LKRTLGGIGGFIKDHKGPISADAKLLVPHGKVIMRGLMAGIASQMGDLRGLLSTATDLVGGSPNLSLVAAAGTGGRVAGDSRSKMFNFEAGSVVINAYDEDRALKAFFREVQRREQLAG
jgi:hypothetical protein